MPSFFLALQQTYDFVIVALFSDATIINCQSIAKQEASRALIPTIEKLLATISINPTQLAFIAADQGPGPITTLRVLLATANGLAFSTNVPLVGIDILELFSHDYQNPTYPHTIYLLNGFNRDVFYAQEIDGIIVKRGYAKIDQLLMQVKSDYSNQPIRFMGNGAALYQHEIQELLGTSAYLPSPLPLMPSIEQFGSYSLSCWQKQIGLSEQLLPLYTKNYPIASAIF